MRRQVRRHEQAFTQVAGRRYMMIEACGFGDAPLMESCLKTQAAQRFTEVANQPLGTTDLSASSLEN